MPLSRELMNEKRDHKVKSAMAHFAPLWLVNDEYRPREDSLVFNLVYDSPTEGWISQHFKYDAFNDVLYHMGEKHLKEDEAIVFQDQEPYLGGEVATSVPNAPAARLSPSLHKHGHGS